MYVISAVLPRISFFVTINADFGTVRNILSPHYTIIYILHKFKLSDKVHDARSTSSDTGIVLRHVVGGDMDRRAESSSKVYINS
jgi:hypothetical protein